MRVSRRSALGLRAVALLYLALLLLLPVGVVFGHALSHGIGALWASITTPAAVSAFWLTVTIAAVAVPLNTIFGVGCALALVRGSSRGRKVVDALLDVPFVVSPVVIGLALVLVYGQGGWFGGWLIRHGLALIYHPAGMVLATLFVSLPFVVREVAPVLIEIGDQQEQAAATLGAGGWQTFWRVTLPSIRWAVAYGVVLTTARSLGEFGAVSVVSSKVAGSTLTLPLLVQQRVGDLGAGGLYGAYAAAALLAVMSVLVLVAMTVLGPGRKERG
jgi:sulfate transport system permease protein